MLVSCTICSELLLPSDLISSTPCGHIFHVSCLNRWISCNNTCPQCRQACSHNTIHRIYLPEVNFQDQDQLIERMNEINRTKNECEGKLKQIEQEKKKLENDLKKKKKEFHRVMQRTITMRKKGTSNIPPRHLKRAAVSTHSGTEQRAHGSKNTTNRTTPQQQSKKRNLSRIQRSKRYFQRKRSEHRNNNNNNGALAVAVEIDDNMEVQSIAESSVASPLSLNGYESPLGSPAISVSSDTLSN